MKSKIKGVVITEPTPEGKRIKFLLFESGQNKEVSCFSSLSFAPNADQPIKINDALTLIGDWVPNIPPSPSIIFLLIRFFAENS